MGPLAGLETLVERWRETLDRPAPVLGVEDPAVALRRRLWEPVATHLAGVKLVLISPDGPLNRLPFAMHGFFAPPSVAARGDAAPAEIQEAPGADASNRSPDAAAVRQEIIGFHPGLLAGLVLAGANRPAQPGQDDGILTALEVADLELRHVELV